MIRPLTDADVPHAIALSDAAGWNQTEADWRALLELQPDGCFGLECDARLVATTTIVYYGETLAWVGMVLTDSAYRGRGFARQLITRALQAAEERHVRTVKLDATDMGRPLYESAGFRAEQPVERWLRQGPPRGEPVRNDASSRIWKCDADAFGADRSRVLERLAGNGRLVADDHGFVITRPGGRAGYIGPCVAANQGVAERLIHDVLDGSQYSDVLCENRAAVDIVERLGFRCVRRLTRMYRGEVLNPNAERNVFGIAGFEWG